MSGQGAKSGQALRLRDRERFAGPFHIGGVFSFLGPVRPPPEEKEANEMSNARGAHLVGGLSAPDASTAMTTTAGALGRHLHRITDGETGPRSQWIWWQIDKLTAIDGITVGAPQVN